MECFYKKFNIIDPSNSVDYYKDPSNSGDLAEFGSKTKLSGIGGSLRFFNGTKHKSIKVHWAIPG